MPTDPTRTVLLRSLAAVAGADGRVGEEELATISDVFVELTGEDAPVDELREIVEAGWEGRPDPVGFVSSVGAEADLETRLLVAEGSYRVLASDGEITGPEAQTFNALLEALRLSRKDVLDRL